MESNEKLGQRSLFLCQCARVSMSSNSIPVYRHGRKFYVSPEEYELLRAEERRHRRRVVQKAQNLPVTKPVAMPTRSASSSLINPLRRTASNPFDQQASILKASYNPVQSTFPTPVRRGSARPSRSILRNSEDPSSSVGSFVMRKNSSDTNRAHSLDKVRERRRPSPADEEYLSNSDEIKRSTSAELIEPQALSDKQAANVPSRRPVPTTVADYGMSPISSFSMTPTDQTYSQSNASKLTSYFVQVKPSSLNPLTKSNHRALLETGLQGTDHAYTVLGSSNRRSGSGGDGGSSIVTRSTSNSTANEFFSRDAASGSFSEDSSSSLLMLVQRRKVDTTRYRRPNFIIESDDQSGEQPDGWTNSATQSQLTDISMEKKRVRFADMEGFTLETISDKTSQRSPVNTRLLTRRKHSQVTNDLRTPTRPVVNNFYQAIAGVGGGYSRRSKLATDV